MLMKRAHINASLHVYKWFNIKENGQQDDYTITQVLNRYKYIEHC